LVKLFPALILPALFRRLPNRRLTWIAVSALLLLAVPLAGLYLASPQFTRANLSAMSSRQSHETVWALIDGNLTVGGFGPLAERLDPDLATSLTRKPAVIPPLLVMAIFGAFGLFLLLKAHLDTSSRTLAFYGVTLVIFFLWSPTWSPQWILHLLPVMLLVLPYSPGLLLTAALVLVNLLEWPVMLSRGLTATLPLTILLRFALMLLLGVLFWQKSRE
jgi:hypothetical protein